MFVSVHFSQLFIFNADVQQIQIVRSIGLLTLVGAVTPQYQSHYICDLVIVVSVKSIWPLCIPLYNRVTYETINFSGSHVMSVLLCDHDFPTPL